MSKLSIEPIELKVTSASPVGTTAESWCYEEPGGICVVVELRAADGRWLGTTQTMVRNSVINTFQRNRESV